MLLLAPPKTRPTAAPYEDSQENIITWLRANLSTVNKYGIYAVVSVMSVCMYVCTYVCTYV